MDAELRPRYQTVAKPQREDQFRDAGNEACDSRRVRGGRIVGRQNGMMTRTRMLISSGALLAGAVVLGWVIVVVFAGAVDGLDPSWNRLMIQIRQPWMLAIAYAPAA